MQLAEMTADVIEDDGAPASPPSAQRPLKICLLGYRSAPYGGGQGIYIKYLSKALVNAGHEVDVISGEPYPHLDPRVNLIKMPGLNLYEHYPHHIRALRPHHLMSLADMVEWASMATGGFAEPYAFGRRMVKHLRRYGRKYDLVHDNQSLCYGLLDLQRMGIPTVATVHHPITRDLKIALDAAPGWRDKLLIKRWHSFLNMQKRVIRQLDNIVTVSSCSQRDIASGFGISENDISLVYNGIDTEEFCPRDHIVRNPMRIMATASADQPLKGLKYLLEAYADLLPRYPELELLVVGKLNAGGYTERLLQRLNIVDKVKFVSGISTEELVDYYAEASVAVVPSLYEGFGLPAGEAMACAVPVVSTSGGALPEVVGDAGLVVEPGSRSALAEAIDSLLSDDEKRLAIGEAGRQRILEKFSWTVAAREMTDYYYQVLESQHRLNNRLLNAR